MSQNGVELMSWSPFESAALIQGQMALKLTLRSIPHNNNRDMRKEGRNEFYVAFNSLGHFAARQKP